MSKLEKLIQQYCPDGVEWKPLGELGDFYSGLSGKTKSDFTGGNEKFITYVNVFNNPSLKTDVPEKVKIAEGERQNTIQYGDILFTGSSETPDECGMSSVLTHKTEEKLYLNSFCFGFRFYDLSDKCPSFMKYLFRSTNIRKAICKTANGVTRYNISKKEFAKIEIPIIPLPVQEEIVRVLDTFTELQAELQAELQKRLQQYEYYKKQVFLNCSCPVQYSIDEICTKITDGSHFSPKSVENGYHMPSVKDMLSNGFDFTSCKQISEEDYKLLVKNGCQPKVNDILIAKDGSMLKYAFPVSEEMPIVVLSSIAILSVNTAIVKPAFLAYYFKQKSFKDAVIREYSTKGGVPRIVLKNFKRIEVSIPSLEEQQRIVSILDRFDTLTNDLTSGLPAEIEKRRQQYEFYRDKLLTLKRKEE